MKSILPIIACLVAVCPAQPAATDELSVRMKSALISRVVADLREATNIVVCDFQPPGGSIITRVLRGKFIKPGQYWNSPMFPKGPVLAYENLTDHLGESNSSVVLQSSSHYRLDPTMKFIVVESWSDKPGDKKDLLIPLQDIEERLGRLPR